MADYTLEQALRMSTSTVESQETTSTILVDVDTREITIPEGELLFGVEDDEKVEIKHIKLNKRYIDGNVDLSQFQFRISYENANGDRNYDIVTNVSVSESAIEFDWLLGRSATLYNGTTSFIVCAVTVNTSTGKVTNEWNSAIGKGNVKIGIKATVESIGGKDLVAQLQTLISTATLLSNNAIEASSRAENSANSAAQSAATADKLATDAAKSSADADRTANSIKDSMAQISENKEAVSQLKADLSANSVADAETRRKLDYLWKLNQGISYQFETDDTEAYNKTVPSGAKIASVHKIGGRTIAWNQLFDLGTFNVTTNINTETNKVVPIISGHTYLLSITIDRDLDSNNVARRCFHWNYGFTIPKVYGSTTSYKKGVNYFIAKAETSYENVKPHIWFQDKCVLSNIMLFDLTAMFGEGNEPTSIDDRIAWIEQYAATNPEYNGGGLVSAEVERIKYNHTVIAAIPNDVRNLPGYGWSAGDVCNSIERTDTGWQYVQRVGCVDLGALDYIRSSEPQRFEAIQAIPSISATPTDRTPNVICDIYVPVPSDGGSYPDMCIYINKNGFIRIHDASRYSLTRDEFKTAMSGVMLYYELVDAIITDITDLMDGALDAIPVEVGGTLTFDNAAKLPVPTSVEYLISLAEVNG